VMRMKAATFLEWLYGYPSGAEQVGVRPHRSFSFGGHLLCRSIVAPGGEFPCPLWYSQFIGGYLCAMALPGDFKTVTRSCRASPHGLL